MDVIFTFILFEALLHFCIFDIFMCKLIWYSIIITYLNYIIESSGKGNGNIINHTIHQSFKHINIMMSSATKLHNFGWIQMTHSQVPGWTHLRVQLCVVAENWDSEGAPDFQHYRGVEGHVRSPGIRLGRGTRRSSLNLHPKQTTKWLVYILGHPWVLGQATGTLTHKTHHDPDSGEATTFPHIVFSAPLHGDYTRMAHFPRTPKLESRNCPKTVPVGVSELWELITPDCRVWSRRGLNQSCSPRRDLSNAMLHSQFGGWNEVDSWLLVVGNQTANLTPDPSFAHNLGCRCKMTKIFSMTPRTPQCEVFWLSNSKHSGVLEDSKSPTLGMGISSSHFTQSGVATLNLFSQSKGSRYYNSSLWYTTIAKEKTFS